MAVSRLSISVAPEVEENIRRAAADSGLTVSTWIARVASNAALLEDGRRAVREHESDHGELDEASRAEARTVLDQIGIGRTSPPTPNR